MGRALNTFCYVKHEHAASAESVGGSLFVKGIGGGQTSLQVGKALESY